MISEVLTKELFEEIMQFKVNEFEVHETLVKYYRQSEPRVDYLDNKIYSSILINDLFFFAKEWASQLGYVIISGNRADGTTNYDVLTSHKDEDIEDGDATYYSQEHPSEQEAVFKACVWILEQTKKDTE